MRRAGYGGGLGLVRLIRRDRPRRRDRQRVEVLAETDRDGVARVGAIGPGAFKLGRADQEVLAVFGGVGGVVVDEVIAGQPGQHDIVIEVGHGAEVHPASADIS